MAVKLKAAATTRIAMRIAGSTMSPASAAVATNPSQAVPGKSTTAATRGEAQPMMQRGGTALAVRAAFVSQGRKASRLVHRRNHGRLRHAAAASQRTTPYSPFVGQYARDVGMIGVEAAA